MNRICPLMSKHIIAKNAYGQDVSEMQYEDCQEKNCVWWIVDKNQCAIVALVEKA